MKLIKCKKCGRPFYDNEAKCPYCGSDVQLSAGNYVTQAISDETSHQTMEAVLSGNYHPQPAPEPEPEPVVAPAEPQQSEPIVPEAPAAMPEAEANSDRAEAMAAIEAAQQEVVGTADEMAAAMENEVESAPAPRKRHGWIWIIIILLILAAAAAAWWKWDFIYPKVMSLLGK
ncbi:MAG: hypothetical protein IKN84_01920 [Bacteroidales bacterium]|nr:hypothetical protein [Bacteroidales bacterium]